MSTPRKLSAVQSAALAGLGRKQKRARNQAGTVEPAGKRRPIWRGFYYVYEMVDGKEVRRRKSVELGIRKSLTLKEARVKLAALIQKKTAEADAAKTGELTLEWFWRERFLPTRQSRWKPASRYTIEKGIWPCYIAPKFGHLRLEEIDAVMIQKHLDWLGKQDYGKSTIYKTRTWINAAMAEAVEQGFITKNPAGRCHLPPIAKREKPFATVGAVTLLLSELDFRDALILRLAMVCGLRRSEIFALRWNDYRGESLMVDESVWRILAGDTKTESSEAPVSLPESLQRDIRVWFEKVTEERGGFAPAHDEWMFQSSNGTPVYADNFLRRNLKPAAKRAGISWFNFRAARRTCATHLDTVAEGVKNVQAHLRHASPEMTLGTYIQAIPSAVRKAVESLDLLLTGKKKEDEVKATESLDPLLPENKNDDEVE